jgi:osmotically-inducible protein OsmY
MKFRSLLTGTAMAALLSFTAAAPAAETNADKEASLQKLLVEKLGKDAAPIHVTIVGEKTTLTGEVVLRATQELADEVLKYAGVKKIDNQIKAKDEKGLLSGKTGREFNDAKLEKEVGSKVKGEVGSTHYKELTIECVGETCSVRGTLPDQGRKDLALKTAAGVAGVKQVVDLVRLK